MRGATPSYVEIYPRGFDVVQLDAESATHSGFCSTCGFPRPGSAGVDVTITDTVPRTPPFEMTWKALMFARSDLLDVIGWDLMGERFAFGTVTNSLGCVLTDWQTLVPRTLPVTVRQVRKAGYRFCSGCGRVSYFAMGRRYLCPPPTNLCEVIATTSGSLLLRSDVAARVPFARWRKLGHEKVHVLDQPLDGLPIILDREHATEPDLTAEEISDSSRFFTTLNAIDEEFRKRQKPGS